MDDLNELHARILACTKCADAGYIQQAAPVVAGRVGNSIMLIGQAPGVTEVEARRPFHGRAGRELFRWMASIGITEDEFRRNVYMTAITKCYPGKSPSGNGDRRPSTAEIGLCRPWLAQQLALIKPETILLVGTLAIESLLSRQPLNKVIGRRFDTAGIRYVPLPHPSGASRWLNHTANKVLLKEALALVREEWNLRVLTAV